MYCAPSIDVSSHYTCFDHNELVQIAKAFNKYIQNNKVCAKQKGVCVPKKQISITGRDKKQLWDAIYNRLSKVCKYEYCWLDLGFVDTIDDADLRDKIKYFTFKPKTTKGRRSWLSTQNIKDVMIQYEKFDKTFKFVGALPSDFYKHVRVNYDDMHNYKNVGFVFNLDTHDMPGSHWVAFLIDNVTRTCEYFDSTGGGPNRHIKLFINKVMSHLPQHRYLQNTIVHQTKNGECGVYSIYYLIQRLLGATFDQVVSRVIRDDDMNKFRNLIFRPLTKI